MSDRGHRMRALRGMKENSSSHNDDGSADERTPLKNDQRGSSSSASGDVGSRLSGSGGGVVEDEEAREFMQDNRSSDHSPELASDDTAVEYIAESIRKRREDRCIVTADVRTAFLDSCRKKAVDTAGNPIKLNLSALEELREECKNQEWPQHHPRQRWWYALFCMKDFDEHQMLLDLHDRAIQTTRDIGEEWFYYRDFVFYSTKIVSRWQLSSHEFVWSLVMICMFYAGTSFFFCIIWPNSEPEICPDDPTGLDRKLYGLVTSLYFASVTMSTVGYGDVTLDVPSNTLHGIVGIIYMIVALIIGYTVFSRTAEAALAGVSESAFRRRMAVFVDSIVPSRWLEEDAAHFIHYRLWRMGTLRTLEIVLYFLACNTIGTIIARSWFLLQTESASNDFKGDWEKWTWTTTFYWAVQTSTTIGYGDLKSGHETLLMRAFKIFYSTFGSFLVGGCFGALAGLRHELRDCSRYFAWKRREVSKRLILDMKGPGDEFEINEFEFFVGSLLALGKVDDNDVRQIMDKFRSLANGKQFISFKDTEDEVTRVDNKEQDEKSNKNHMWLDIDKPSTKF